MPAREALPEDIEAERCLLATICAGGAEGLANEILATTTVEDFVHPSHRAIFRALTDLLADGMELSAVGLKSYLEQAKALGLVGGYTGLVDILSAEEVSRPAAVAATLHRKRAHRQLMRLGRRLAQQAESEDAPPEKLIEGMSRDLATLASTGTQPRGLEPLHDVVDRSLPRLSQQMAGKIPRGLRMGFPRFDSMTQGLQGGNLIILAARPGIGKTSLALNWTLKVALAGAHVAFFSLEMSSEEVYLRLLSTRAKLNMKTAQAGLLETRDEGRLYTASDELRDLPIYVNDQATLTVPAIVGQVDRHLSRAAGHLDLVVIDYLQLLSTPDSPRASRQTESTRIAEISRGLKLLAKDRNIPVVVLSQLNREVEHRTGGRPQLSDLRDSGALEQDADIVAFLHRKTDYPDPGKERDRTTELIIAKQRNGPTGVVQLHFNDELTSYHELDRNTAPEPILVEQKALGYC